MEVTQWTPRRLLEEEEEKLKQLLQLKEEQERYIERAQQEKQELQQEMALQSRSLQQAQQQLEEVRQNRQRADEDVEVRPGVEQVAGGRVSRGTGSGTFPGALSLRPYHHLTVWPLTTGLTSLSSKSLI